MKGFEFEDNEMARVLLLVSREQAMQMPMPMLAPVAVRGDHVPERTFVCTTCGRVFPSFQALGGHRASHKKARMDGDGGDLKPKLHSCSVCGLEFAVGQALGGHMRRHRAMAAGAGEMPPVLANEKHGYGAGSNDVVVGGGIKLGLWLDLNLPPCGDNNWMDVDADAGRECAHDNVAAGYTFHQFLPCTPPPGTMAVDCV